MSINIDLNGIDLMNPKKATVHFNESTISSIQFYPK